MFQGGASQNALASNPMVSQMISSVAANFAAKFGVSSAQAQSIVTNLLPTVMNQFIKKTNDPKDNSFDLTNMMKTMSGNNNLDVASIVGQLAGGKSNQIPWVLWAAWQESFLERNNCCSAKVKLLQATEGVFLCLILKNSEALKPAQPLTNPTRAPTIISPG